MGLKPIGERICLDCDALAVEGSMRCAPCRDKALKENKAAHRARQAVRYEKLGVPSRRLTGTCPDCGKAIRSDSTRCLPCSLVFSGKRKEQRAAEAAAAKAERAAQAQHSRADAKRAKIAKADAERRKREIDYSTSTNMARFMWCKECGKYVRREDAHTDLFCSTKCQESSKKRTAHFSNKSSWEMRV